GVRLRGPGPPARAPRVSRRAWHVRPRLARRAIHPSSGGCRMTLPPSTLDLHSSAPSGASRSATPRPGYVRFAAAAHRGRWSVERDVRWSSVDPARAHERSDLLAQLRTAALIESYHPVHLGWMLHDTWDDIDAGAAI